MSEARPLRPYEARLLESLADETLALVRELREHSCPDCPSCERRATLLAELRALDARETRAMVRAGWNVTPLDH